MQNADKDLPLDRRAFLRAAASFAATLAVLPRRAISEVSIPALTIGFLSSDLYGAALGFNFGIHEAKQSANLFGKDVNGVARSITLARDGEATIEQLVGRQRATVILAGGNDETSRAIADTCIRNGTVFINVTSRSDDLRRSVCSPLVFHVEASDAMYDAADKLAGNEKATTALWDSSLERYGASQLNDRYRASAGTEMTGPAWAAWIAVKVVSEAFFRAGDASAKSIASHLSRDSTQFDGHKGAPLSFRAWDHQLRQPLYSVDSRSGARVVKDIPDLARSAGGVREVLDTIGDTASDSHCRMNQ